MRIDLSERVAIVTGATRGIGLAIVKRLADAGAHVVLNGRRNEQQLVEAAESIRLSARVQVLPVLCDVGSAQGAATLAKAAFEAFRRIDILVNNAGVLKEAPIGMISHDDTTAMIEANLLSVIHLTQAVSRPMARRKNGSI